MFLSFMHVDSYLKMTTFVMITLIFQWNNFSDNQYYIKLLFIVNVIVITKFFNFSSFISSWLHCRPFGICQIFNGDEVNLENRCRNITMMENETDITHSVSNTHPVQRFHFISLNYSQQVWVYKYAKFELNPEWLGSALPTKSTGMISITTLFRVGGKTYVGWHPTPAPRVLPLPNYIKGGT